MKITLIIVGRTKEKWLIDGENEYKKRLSAFCDLQIIEVAEEKGGIPEEEIQKREGERILAKIASSEFVVLLDDKGKERSSEELAEWLRHIRDFKTGAVTLVVGGPYGFSEAVYTRANEQISLSKLTFTHQMVRVILLEQLYRAFSILSGRKYHHS